MKYNAYLFLFLLNIFTACSKNYEKETQLAYDSKDYIKTIEIANKGLAKKENVLLYELRGLSYFELKDYEHASKDLNKVVSTGKGSIEVLEKSVLTNVYLDRNELAILGYKELIKYDSLNASYYYYQGVAYRKIGEFDKAFNQFVKSTRLDSNYYYKAYNEIGVIYQTMNDYNKSIGQFNESIKLDSTTAVVFFNRGVSYAYLEKYEEALRDFDKAINIDSNLGRVYYNRAMVYMFRNEKIKSCADLDKAISLGYNQIDSKIKGYCSNNNLPQPTR